jgi:hypothetical protein
MKILRLAQARLLLWAHDRVAGPFEVSKVVTHRLQPLCSTAPRCPDDLSFFEPAGPAWIDPIQEAHPECPYAFARRGECLRHRNQLALEAALFAPGEVELTRRLLEALGFRVTTEAIDPVRENTVLAAHGEIGPSHDVRLLQSPVAGPIVLVRDQQIEVPPRVNPRRQGVQLR